jgi:hypothetical protein
MRSQTVRTVTGAVGKLDEADTLTLAQRNLGHLRELSRKLKVPQSTIRLAVRSVQKV